MRKIQGLLWGCLLIAALSACTYSVHQVNTSDFSTLPESTPGRMITAESTQMVIWWFTFDTDYLTEAYKKLQQQCTDHPIQGITTQYSTSHGFFHWTNRILMKGTCLESM